MFISRVKDECPRWRGYPHTYNYQGVCVWCRPHRRSGLAEDLEASWAVARGEVKSQDYVT